MDKELQDNLERTGLGGLVDTLLQQTVINVNNEKRIRSLENISKSLTGKKLSNVKLDKVSSEETVESESTTLKKLYTFLVKSSDEDRKKYELDKNFEQERREESDRKFDKLIKVVSEKTKIEKKKEQKDEKESFFKKLFGTLIKGFGIIFKLVGFTLIKTISAGLFMIKKSLSGLGTFLQSAFNTVSGILSKVFSFMRIIRVVSVIGRLFSIVTGLIGTVAAISTGMGGLIMRTLIGLLSSSSEVVAILASKIKQLITPMIENLWNIITKTIKSIPGARMLGTLGAVLGAVNIGSELVDQSDRLRYGDEWADLRKKRDELENEISGSAGISISPQHKKEKEQQKEKISKQMVDAADTHYKNVVLPAFLKEGYKPVTYTDGTVETTGFEKDGDFVQYGERSIVGKQKSLFENIIDYPQKQSDAITVSRIVGKHKIGNMIDEGKKKISEMTTDVESAVSDLPKKAESYATETYEKIKDKAVDVGEGAGSLLKEYGLDIESLKTEMQEMQKMMEDLAKQKYEQVSDTASGISESVSSAAGSAVESAESMMQPAVSAASDIAGITSESFEGVNNVPSALNAVGATIAKSFERLTGGADSSSAKKAFSFAGTLSNLANMDVMSGTQSFISLMAEKANQGLSLDDDKVFSDVVKEFWGKMTASPMGSVPSEKPGIVDKLQQSYTSNVPTLNNMPVSVPAAGINIPPEPSEDINNVVDAIGAINTPINNVYNNKTESSGEVYLGSPPVRNQNWSLRMIDITSAVPL